MSRQAAARDRKLDDVFSALSDRTRRRLLARLAEGPATIGELAAPLPMTLPAVSKHLRVLERAGLVKRERRGWYQHCEMDARPMQDAAAFIARYRPFWTDALDRLAAYAEKKR
ncbi:MAG TPA: metalloregulator ArsR/SmtB family transcription factor [Polyangiaceae bacterium]|jgi:DNA-binding transcriptional ArsR family regulator